MAQHRPGSRCAGLRHLSHLGSPRCKRSLPLYADGLSRGRQDVLPPTTCLTVRYRPGDGAAQSESAAHPLVPAPARVDLEPCRAPRVDRGEYSRVRGGLLAQPASACLALAAARVVCVGRLPDGMGARGRLFAHRAGEPLIDGTGDRGVACCAIRPFRTRGGMARSGGRDQTVPVPVRAVPRVATRLGCAACSGDRPQP